MYQTKEDRVVEAEVAAALGRALNCEVHGFGDLSPVDYWAERGNRPVAVMELKSRSHPRGKYPTVFLSMRKWLVLTMASMGLGVKALFVVRWTDALGYVDLSRVDGTRTTVGGRWDRGARNDREPLIEVPVSAFTLCP